jgi:hypothetical protein
MIKKPLEYPRNGTRLIPPEHGEHNGKRQLTKQIMGGMVMGECESTQRKFCIAQTDYIHFQGGYGRLQLGDFTHAMDFFKEHTSYKKQILEHFFIRLLNDLSTKDLVTLCNLLST